MAKQLYLIVLFLLFTGIKSVAQDTYTDKVKKYIEQYYPLAIQEQKDWGIPASITLAQGIHETDAGNSILLKKANNHFGVKCKNDWKGEKFIHSDDIPNECFRKYNSAEESYKDHSQLLKNNPRYASLFTYTITDYASWAIGLKKCGYATNPQYSINLIKIIEDYHLQQYTYSALETVDAHLYPTTAELVAKTGNKDNKKKQEIKADSLRKVVDSIRMEMTVKKNTDEQLIDTPILNIAAQSKIINKKRKTDTLKSTKTELVTAIENPDIKYDSDKIVILNGLKAFYAYKDEMLLKYAVKHKVRYSHLLEINDLPDAPLTVNLPIYLEKKLSTGTHSRHTVKEGETMQIISQLEGIQLKRLYALNLMHLNEEPNTGAILYLQTEAIHKPSVTVIKGTNPKKTVGKPGETGKNKPENEYVVIKRPKAIMKDSTDDNEEDNNRDTEQIPEKTRKKEVVATKKEDLNGLKAELDKVVYADDTKLTELEKEQEANKQVNQKNNREKEKPRKPIPVKQEKKKVVKTYTIKKGDTLSGIAEKFNVSVKQLKKWNNIKGEAIRDGKILKVHE